MADKLIYGGKIGFEDINIGQKLSKRRAEHRVLICEGDIVTLYELRESRSKFQPHCLDACILETLRLDFISKDVEIDKKPVVGRLVIVQSELLRVNPTFKDFEDGSVVVWQLKTGLRFLP